MIFVDKIFKCNCVSVYMDEILVQTDKRYELIDVTSDVQNKVNEKGIKNGILCLFVPHTTAAVTINENADPDVAKDLLYKLKKMAEDNYKHAEGNSDSHVLSSLVGCSLNIIIENSQINMGTWQSIYFCEFDGPRKRKLNIEIVGDKDEL